jgi:ELWxxDGT repeat protein
VVAAGFGQLDLDDAPLTTIGNDGVWRIGGRDETSSSLASWPCQWITHSGGILYFVLTKPVVYRDSLWRSDGSAQGTLEVREIPDSSFHAVAFLGGILFTARGPTGREPWISDGTAGGTHLVKDVVPGPADGVESSLFAGPAFAFFRSGDQGGELWRTDGTEAGTAAVPMGDQVVIAVAGQIGSVLYFFTRTTSVPHEHSLWRTDGTPSGTARWRAGYILTGLEIRWWQKKCSSLQSEGLAHGTRPLTSSASGLVAVPVCGLHALRARLQRRESAAPASWNPQTSIGWSAGTNVASRIDAPLRGHGRDSRRGAVEGRSGGGAPSLLHCGAVPCGGHQGHG